MGKMTLGLDDRSARLIQGRDVWTEIRGLLSGYTRIHAAIAFVGSDAEDYLPLRGPATLVVNAGDEALANGSTDPELLLRWTRRGVRIYSLPSLHAKAVLVEGDPSFVLVGSANASWVSANRLDEAVLVADERETVDELRDAIAGWKRLAGDALTEDWLQQAMRRIRPAARPAPRPEPAVAPRPVVAAPTRASVPPPPVRPVVGPSPAPAPVQAPPVPVVVGEPAISADPDPVADRVGPPPGLHLSADAAGDGSPPEAGDDIDPAAAAGVGVDESSPGDAEPANSERAEGAGDESVDPRPAEADPDDDPDDEVEPALDPDVPIRPVIWPRPKYIYLAPLSRDGKASPAALEQLEQFRSDYRVPHAFARQPVLDVLLYWWDDQRRSGGKSHTVYREGWHVVPIGVNDAGRPAVLSQVDSPGRVLYSFTDFQAGPSRTYYYVLAHTGGISTTFRKLRETLTAVGEKPSYDHAYMMQHKVDAILGLWPQIGYTD